MKTKNKPYKVVQVEADNVASVIDEFETPEEAYERVCVLNRVEHNSFEFFAMVEVPEHYIPIKNMPMPLLTKVFHPKKRHLRKGHERDYKYHR